MSKHERFTTAVNDSTGDLIKTKASNQQAYAKGWEAIFGKEKFIPYSPPTTAGQVLQKLVDEGVLTDNVTRRHEEQNIGKGVAVFEEEHIAAPFVEELLPSGIIGDEV